MNHVGDHHQLGTALQKQGDLKGATTEYRIVLRLDSDHVDAHYNLGIQLKTCLSLSFSHPNVLKRVWELPIS
jgi:Tfp pilus assembly protein PilF